MGSGNLLLCSSELQPLPRKRQGPMVLVNCSELLHRHGKSAAEQPISAAAFSRQGRAQVGSWWTRLATSAVVAVVGGALVVVVALWPRTGAIKMVAAERRVVNCIVDVVSKGFALVLPGRCTMNAGWVPQQLLNFENGLAF